MVASGTVEARADDAALTTPAIGLGARLSTTIAFADADYRTRSVTFPPGLVRAEALTVTRAGRVHRGGHARVDVLGGRVTDGVPRDVPLRITARHPDLSWLAYRSPAGSVKAGAGEVGASLMVRYPASLVDGSAEEAAVTGSIASRASGEGSYGDTRLRFELRTSAVVEALDFGRRTLRLGKVHVTARDVAIDRGPSHPRGWWGDFDTPRFEGSVMGPVELSARVDTHCQSGAPFSAILTSADLIPGWVGVIFPMNDLRVAGQVSLRRGAVDFAFRARGSSATVTADLRHANRGATGVVHVATPLVSLGVELAPGHNHLAVFVGKAWLDERIAAVEAEAARVTPAPAPSAARP
jgi:hypothetical protein